jgi:hypothetical protein
MYSIVGIIFSFFPPTVDVTPESMNWSVVVFFGVMIFSLIYWFVHGRFVYEGPIREIPSDDELP